MNESELNYGRDYVARVIEIIDERGITNCEGNDPVLDILGEDRDWPPDEVTLPRDDRPRRPLPWTVVVRAKAFLIGAGELDSSDIWGG